jgi:hypothetical protein
MHDFAESLAMSHSASDLPLWGEVYRAAFPGFSTMVDHRQDGEHQRAGIDRSVILENSKQILIDEKVRWRNRRTNVVYEDIALEYLSNAERRVPGWVCKPLRADYIAYAIAPLGRCYLLPVMQLQLAWARCGKYWVERYRSVEAKNKTYTTVSVGVPVSEVFAEVGRSLRASFTPVESAE